MQPLVSTECIGLDASAPMGLWEFASRIRTITLIGSAVRLVALMAPTEQPALAPMTVLVNDEDLRSAIFTEIENAPPHALYSAHPNSGQRHVFQIFKRHLSDITKKQAEKIVNVWIDEGRLHDVDFQDNKSRDQKGLAVCE
jgi:hypothetical protein